MAHKPEDPNLYSQLNDTDESLFIIGTFVLNSMGLMLCIIILLSFYLHSRKMENKQSFNFAVVSVICSAFVYLTALIFGNDLILSWNYDSEHISFVSIVDSIFMVFYTFGKIAFYCSFTYHVLKIFDPNDGTARFLMVWMIVASISVSLLMIGYLIDDILDETTKEIGVTNPHNIHLTMFGSHEGAVYAHAFAFILMFVDMIYFIVLIYCYIKQLRLNVTMNNNGNSSEEPEVNGVVLLFVACVVFWIVLVFVGSGSALLWLGPLDFISDDICLFLLFNESNEIYRFCCKTCDGCCLRVIYGPRGYQAVSVEVRSDEDETDTM